MDKKTEALKLAEDALKRVRTQDMELVQLSMIALAAIREALAEQPAPPPECQTEAEKTAYAFGWFKALESVRKRPAEQKPKKDLMYSTVAMQERHAAFVDRAVATLEQAKREALAEQPAQQEPVAWMYQCSADSSGPVLMQNKRDWAESSSGLWTETPLYKSPPASKPLTDEEIKSVIQSIDPAEEYLPRALQQFARAIEAKLKEKNA